MWKRLGAKLALAAALAVLPGNLIALLIGVLSGTETYALFFIGLTVYLYSASWALKTLLSWQAPPRLERRVWLAAKLGALALLLINVDFATALLWAPARNTANRLVWVLPLLNFILAWILAAYYLTLRFKYKK